MCKQKRYHLQLHSYLVLFAVSRSHEGWAASEQKLMVLSVHDWRGSQVAPQRKAISWDHSYRHNIQASTKEPLKTESEVNIWETGWWHWWTVFAFQPRRKRGKMSEKSEKYSRRKQKGKKTKPNNPPNKQTKKPEEGFWNLKGPKCDLVRNVNYDSIFFRRETKENLKDFWKFLSFQKMTHKFQENMTRIFSPFCSIC